MRLDKGKLTAALAKASCQADAGARHELLDLLRAEEELKVFDGSSLASHAVFVSVSYERLADWLMDRSRALGADQTVSDLARFLEQEAVPVHVVAPLGGVVTQEEIDLGPGITLLPLGPVPESQAKAHFLERIRWPGHRVLWRFQSGFPALMCPRFRDKGHADGDRWVRPDPPEMYEIHERMLDICRVLTIVGPSAPVCLGLWEQTEDWVPCGDCLYLDEWFWTWHDAEVPSGWRDLKAVDLAQAKALFGRYMPIAGEDRQKLRIAIDRLNESMRRRNPEDAAIDLGISLEALFLQKHDRDKARKLSQRAAEFLGVTDAERNAELMAGIYELRNCAVHEGKVDDQKAVGELKRGWEITAEALRKVVMQGKLPNWNQVTFR